MKVALNGTCFNNRPSGARQRFVGIYTELAKTLSEVDFILYEPEDCRVGAWFEGLKNVSVRKTPIPSEGRLSKVAGGFRYWRSELKRARLSLFEDFSLPLVKSPSGKTLLTIHDIRFMHPDWQWAERVAYKRIIKSSIQRADHVLTVSETMKKEIARFFPRASIFVIPNGLDAAPFEKVSAAELLEIRTKFSLPENYLLAVGHLEHRKNYGRLMSAVSLLRNRGHDISLVIVGNDSGLRATLRRKAAEENLTDCVWLLSGLSDHDVRCLYRLSGLFVFASVYEGFGIPILEAMAARIPMVLSDISVFREITQNQGVYFSPIDTDAIADAIETVLTSKREQQRLIQYGDSRIADFKFRDIASQLAQVYLGLKSEIA